MYLVGNRIYHRQILSEALRGVAMAQMTFDNGSPVVQRWLPLRNFERKDG